ncbi:MAG: complex I NDUFA9 subunit family protein [Gammaproteobacteria bacterium]
MDIQKICVLGGGGFIGTHLISKLVRQNKSIRVLTRRKSNCNHLLVLNNVEVVEADIHQQDELEQHFAGMDTVINLIGILNERGHKGDGFRQSHVELPRKILNASHSNKIQRILHMSALNADANSGSSHYLRSKGDGENHMHAFAGSIKVTSFRPSIVFGHDDSFFNRFAKLLKLSPVFFPLACPNARFAPIYVEDLVQFMADSLYKKSSFGQRYDLCGPRQYTLFELVTYTAETMGLNRIIIKLPDTISRIQASLLERFPGKPFSVDNFNSLKTDSICKNGVKFPTTIEAIIPNFLGQRQKNLNLDHNRRQARRS